MKDPCNVAKPKGDFLKSIMLQSVPQIFWNMMPMCLPNFDKLQIYGLQLFVQRDFSQEIAQIAAHPKKQQEDVLYIHLCIQVSRCKYFGLSGQVYPKKIVLNSLKQGHLHVPNKTVQETKSENCILYQQRKQKTVIKEFS